ncbi:hypothetical protein [Shewanella psychropiezotolerans]|nr:hypothetical protein [Shewanella psychropiezotolerans]
MAMVTGVSDALSVQHRSQPLSAPINDRQAQSQLEPNHKSNIPTHRLESYSRWAKVTQGQHKVSASQVAEQGLRQITHILKQLKKQTQKALSVEGSLQTEKANMAKRIQNQLTKLKVEYQDTPLIDHQLNLITPSRPAAQREFTMKSVDLASTKPRDEYIQLQHNQKNASVFLPAKTPSQQLREQLALGMKVLGIDVFTHKDSPSTQETIFSTNDKQWQQLKNGIMMTGQGQRLPAGEARNIKLDEKLSWQDPREWKFTSNDELRQAIAKINKSLHKVDQQLRDLTEAKLKVQHQLDKINRSHNSDNLVIETLQTLDSAMQANPFSKQMTSIMAQANVTRAHVSSLLK